MGGWDLYCFLCYAGLEVPYDITHPDDDGWEEALDTEDDGESEVRATKSLFLRMGLAERLAWLSKFRTIGINRRATGLKQCYLSGPAEHRDYGQASIELGDHPNARSLDLDETAGEVACYRNGSEEDGDLPIHESCLTVLCEAFAQARDIDGRWTAGSPSTSLPFDLDTLFACLAPARRDYQSHLSLGHELQTDQYFGIDWSNVEHYVNPLESGLPDTTTNEEAGEAPAPSTADSASNGAPTRVPDVFSRLPTELVTTIMDYVPAMDLPALLRASRTALETTTSSKFWRRRCQLDAPWYWEPTANDTEDAHVDVHQEYKAVMMRALRPVEMAKRGHNLSGFANRRRVWQIAQEVIRLYELISPLASKSKVPPSCFEKGAICRYMPKVADQSSAGGAAEATFCFHTPEDMQSSKRLEFFWSKEALCGVSVTVGTHKVFCGIRSEADTKSNGVDIGKEDWLEKLVLNMSIIETTFKDSYGTERLKSDHFVSGVIGYTLSGERFEFGSTLDNKRLLEPLAGHGVVGFKTEVADGRFTRFGILEHAAGLTKHRAPNDEKRLDLLWRDDLPAQNLRLDRFRTGYWSFDTVWDLVPMEVLLFGTTERELATLTGFGASRDCRCLELYRSDGSTQRIGTSGGVMKTFKIDGPGGERILGFRLVLGALPVGLVLITNHGRQAVFGKSGDNTLLDYTSDHGLGVAGIYCSFAYNSIPSKQLSSLSLVQSPDTDTAAMDARTLMDEHGLMWEPRAPPASWTTTGPVFGSEHKGAVAMILHFSRSILKIEGLLSAPEWLDVVELGGWTVRYDDSTLDSSAVFGLTSQVWPERPDATPEDLRNMTRYDHMAMGGPVQESVGPTAHISTDEEALAQPSTWDLGSSGERLQSITVWAGDFLHGIQFHTESGKISPRWGKCGGEPAARISAGGAEQIVGIKVILGTQRLMRTTCSDVPQAVQAMKME